MNGFVGREAELREIHEGLDRHRSVVITGRDLVDAGIGKTALALEYARRFGGNYERVVHLSARTSIELTCELAREAAAIPHPVTGNFTASQRIRGLSDRLASEGNWLVVIDGAHDGDVVRSMYTSTAAHVIVTARRPVALRLNGGKRVELGPLSARESLDLLQSVGADDMDAATRVCRRVDYVPLGIRVAASLAASGAATWAQTAAAIAGNEELANRRQPVDRVLAIAIDQLARTRFAEMKLLCALTTFTPAGIPLDVVTRGAEELGASIASREIGDLIAELERWNLLAREPDSRRVRLHESVRSLLANSLPPESRDRWNERTIAALNHSLANRDNDTLPTLVCAARRALESGVDASEVVVGAGEQLAEQGLVRSADDLFTQALAHDPGTVHDPDRRIRVLLGLAECRLAMGDGSRAVRYLERAIESNGGATADPVTLADVHLRLADVYRRHRRLAEAAEQLDRIADGGDEPLRARALHQRGLLALREGRTDDGEAVLSEARALAIETGSHLEPWALDARADLAELLVGTRRVDEARTELDEIWETLDEEVVDPGILGRILRLRGDVNVHRGELELAEACFTRSRALDEVAFGVHDRTTGLDLAGLARVRQMQKRHVDARRLLERALPLVEQNHSREDERVPVVLARIARACLEVGDARRAKMLTGRSLRLRSRLPYPPNLDLVEILETRAVVLASRGRHAEAVPLLERAVEIVETSFGDPVSLLSVLRLQLGCCLFTAGRLAEVEPLLAADLDRRRTDGTVGSEDYVVAAKTLAACFEQTERYAEAESLLEELLEVLDARGAERAESTFHHRVRSLRRLSRAQLRLRRFAAARRSIDRSLEILAARDVPRNSARVLRARAELARLHRARREFDTARAILDEIQRVHVDHGGDPIGLSAVQLERGGLERDAGDPAAGRRFIEAALATRESSLGSGHRSTIECLDALADVCLDEDSELAATVANRAVETHRELRIPNLMEFARSLLVEGRAHRRCGRHERAADSLTESLATYERSGASATLAAAEVKRELGLVRLDTGDAAGALPLLVEALTAEQSSLGERESAGCETRLDVVRALSAGGRHDEAVAAVVEVVGARRSRLGDEHEDVTASLRIQEEVYRAAGRDAEADNVRTTITDLATRRSHVLFEAN